ncbi:HAD-IA family hydrolase [Streptomyces atratus]|uniref:HAD-IA family hydrolase n=1 Tax=Streptomyces atratus TaxID=1893 RepID=UPI001E5E9686|nr:HAD-IA family hydrolase [Streptomyces atratus]
MGSPTVAAPFEAELTAVDGIAEALNGLTTPSASLRTATATASRRNLEIVALRDHFAGRIISADDVSTGKPAPDLFLHTARSMGVDPGRRVVIEDSAYGVQAAGAAGMGASGIAVVSYRPRGWNGRARPCSTTCANCPGCWRPPPTEHLQRRAPNRPKGISIAQNNSHSGHAPACRRTAGLRRGGGLHCSLKR